MLSDSQTSLVANKSLLLHMPTPSPEHLNNRLRMHVSMVAHARLAPIDVCLHVPLTCACTCRAWLQGVAIPSSPASVDRKMRHATMVEEGYVKTRKGDGAIVWESVKAPHTFHSPHSPPQGHVVEEASLVSLHLEDPLVSSQLRTQVVCFIYIYIYIYMYIYMCIYICICL